MEEAPLHPHRRHRRQQTGHRQRVQKHDAGVQEAGRIRAGPRGRVAGGIAGLVGGATDRRPGGRHTHEHGHRADDVHAR